MPPARHTYSCHRPRERVTHPPRRHLPCNIVQCACCLTTTQSRSRTALNAAHSAYLLVSPPEREGMYVCMYVLTIKSNPHTAWRLPLPRGVTHPPRRHLPCNTVQCACCLTNYHAVTLPYSSVTHPPQCYQCATNLQCACRPKNSSCHVVLPPPMPTARQPRVAA